MISEKSVFNKKVAIYGVGRVQKGFEYMFEKIKVTGYIIDDESDKKIIDNEKEILYIDDLTKKSFDVVIICDVNKDEKKITLLRKGFKYGVHFFIADDFFESLNYDIEGFSNNRKIMVWGTGKSSKDFVITRLDNNIYGYVDSNKNKRGMQIENRIIYNPEDIDNKKEKYFVIISSTFYFEIKEQLEIMGYVENIDFIWYEILKEKVSSLLTTTLYSNLMYDITCNTVFNTFEIGESGRVSCCCTTFIKQKLGSLLQQDFHNIWYSNVHKVLCLSTENKSFSFCNKDLCPIIMNKEKKEYCKDNENKKAYRIIDDNFRVMAIGIDSTCNLYCSTCRDKIVGAIGSKYEQAKKVKDVIKEQMNKAKLIIMAGDGEIFSSPIYRDMWNGKYGKKADRFRILTNGILFNEKNWTEFKKERDSNILLSVSIDAASKDTYEHIRRGGNYNTLVNNMEYASELRKKGELSYFQINYVISRENYKEILDFIKLGIKWGVDKVFFTKILNWGTYTVEEYEQMTMFNEDGTCNKEIEEIMKDELINLDIVDLGTLKLEHNKGEFYNVESFYEWELDTWMNA